MITAYCDGGSRGNPGKAACAWVVYDNDKEIDSGFAYLGKDQTNNQAEYSGMENLMSVLHNLKLQGVDIYCDSQLVVKQLKGEWKIKDPKLNKVFNFCTGMMVIGHHTIHHIKGHSGIPGNERADQLVNECLNAIEYAEGHKDEYHHRN